MPACPPGCAQATSSTLCAVTSCVPRGPSSHPSCTRLTGAAARSCTPMRTVRVNAWPLFSDTFTVSNCYLWPVPMSRGADLKFACVACFIRDHNLQPSLLPNVNRVLRGVRRCTLVRSTAWWHSRHSLQPQPIPAHVNKSSHQLLTATLLICTPHPPHTNRHTRPPGGRQAGG